MLPESSQKLPKHFDWLLFLSMLALIAIGIIAIFSATHSSQSEWMRQNYQRQLIWAALGMLLFGVAIVIHYKFYMAFAYVFYAISILTLLGVLIGGKIGGGATRWIMVGGIKFQPSEWAKLVTVFALARYLSDQANVIRQNRTLFTAIALGVLPMFLIFEEPDLGTSLVFAAVIPFVLFWADVSPLSLFLLFAPIMTILASFNFYTFFIAMAIIITVLLLVKRSLLFSLANIFLNIGVGILTPTVWNSLHEYQQKRILTFLGLVSDPRGLSYQIIQSKVAIGSGGFWGKGLLHGTQSQLRFLPAQHTDFIFSVIGEELGFVGGILVILLFFIIILRGFSIAANSKNRFASITALGITTIFLYHAVVNMGMAMGIMPVTGLPLPFVSYGGSFLLVSMTAMGVLVNISMRRYEY